MRIVIHGGHFKTGTTSLQQTLAAHRDELAGAGVIYPEGPGPQHARILDARSSSWQGDRLRGIASAAEQSGASVLLLSGEVVSSLSETQFQLLTGSLSPWPVEYVFCFRHWSTYLPSRWIQSCRRRDSQTFGEYLARVSDPGLAHIDTRYDLILSRAAASGAENVIALSWDAAMARENSCNRALLAAARLEPSLIDRLVRDAAWLNPRCSLADAEICRTLNGAESHRRGLPSNELFDSYAEHRVCSTFFDPHRFMLPTLTPSTRSELVAFIHAARQQETAFPDFTGLEELLAERHGPKFANCDAKELFPNGSMRPQGFRACALTWRELWDGFASCQEIAKLLGHISGGQPR